MASSIWRELLLSPFQRLMWRSAHRRARLLLRFAEVEADGGRDLVRAAEATRDPLLRKKFLLHAADEQRHAALFRERGLDILRSLPRDDAAGETPTWLAPGERGLDDLQVEQESEGALLAFLHLSESAAAQDFSLYIRALDADRPTQAVFAKILKDERFHMAYTREQLVRVAPKHHARLLWQARLRRFWRLYLRLAGGLAAIMGTVILTLQYFVLLPPFALLAKRAARAEREGWSPAPPPRHGDLNRQY